jgi:hypothetical protein
MGWFLVVSNHSRVGGFNRFHKFHNATSLEASSTLANLCVVCRFVIWIAHGIVDTCIEPGHCGGSGDASDGEVQLYCHGW